MNHETEIGDRWLYRQVKVARGTGAPCLEKIPEGWEMAAEVDIRYGVVWVRKRDEEPC